MAPNRSLIASVVGGLPRSMTSCCQAADRHFGPDRASRELATYRRRGPTGTARRILALLREAQAVPTSVLDVGAGIGVLHHELLAGTVQSATHVEGASAYLAVARAESERRGHTGRVDFRQGDVVALAPELPSAELVTLDRVVCCYPDAEALLRETMQLATRYYALSFPHDRWYTRLHNAWENFRRRRAGNPFRTFVHPPGRIRTLLGRAGFRCIGLRRTPAWEIGLYHRPDAG
jgi:magnesium-protoporphyrin O-methyltransferase